MGDHTAIEAKAKENVSPHDVKSLIALAQERRLKRYLCVTLEARPRTVGPVSLVPWREFLDALWSHTYTSQK
ncbi:MAG: hypothetical protein HY737_08265 [Candidatus Omnitrophica bacterium]|nr:hypothetical protein [Candidatus Omnitrophota bacterium]